MPILLPALRLLHIVSAFVWFAVGSVFTLYILPAALAADVSGLRYLKSLYTRTVTTRVIPIAASLTTLAGLLLYATGSHLRFSDLGNLVLGIGALAGVAGTIHGAAVTGRATGALGSALDQHIPDDTTDVSVDAQSALSQQITALVTHARVSLILMVIALLGMGSAQYL